MACIKACAKSITALSMSGAGSALLSPVEAGASADAAGVAVAGAAVAMPDSALTSAWYSGERRGLSQQWRAWACAVGSAAAAASAVGVGAAVAALCARATGEWVWRWP
jgi:hypothetical protein